ncbi:MAG TPA: 30S ribosome-binding factor RbfA [Clostridia bacterium]|jgi:ribosome-binding factor A|nr:30S ribosome-binding factor RbfA [Clostridia bacterium]
MNIERVNNELKKKITEIFNSEIKDPRFNDLGIITVMEVNTSVDLEISKVYLSFYNSLITGKEAIKIVQNTAGYIKKQLYGKLKIRKVPNLMFILDESLKYAEHIDALLEQANANSSNKEEID